MANKKFISKIQSGNLENIYREVTQIAAEWTVCGFVDEANKLLENLWSYHLPHERDTWITDQGFQFFWNLSNKYPKNIPFKLGDLDKMEENNWESVFIPNFITNDNIDVPLESLTGKNLLYKALILANPSVDRKGKATEKNYDKALKALEKFISEKPEGYDLFHALTFASILCARNNMSSKALTYLVQWAKNIKKIKAAILYWNI